MFNTILMILNHQTEHSLMIHIPDSALYVPEGHFEQVDEPAIESLDGTGLVAELVKQVVHETGL
jgi:hypothetical protein